MRKAKVIVAMAEYVDELAGDSHDGKKSRHFSENKNESHATRHLRKGYHVR